MIIEATMIMMIIIYNNNYNDNYDKIDNVNVMITIIIIINNNDYTE